MTGDFGVIQSIEAGLLLETQDETKTEVTEIEVIKERLTKIERMINGAQPSESAKEKKSFEFEFNGMVQAIFLNSCEKGFWCSKIAQTPNYWASGNIRCLGSKEIWQSERAVLIALSKLALIHSEVSEAIEEVRKQDFNKEAFCEELADVVIRVMDLAGALDLNLGKKIEEKHEKNTQREYMHGKTS